MVNQYVDKKELLIWLDEFSEHPSSYLILEDNISHFTTDEFPGVIGFEVCTGIAFVVGEPIVANEHYERFLSLFMDYCNESKLKVCFFSVNDQHWEIYKKFGFNFQEYGLEALLKAEEFTLKGSAFAKVRWGVNKLTRLGYTILEYTPSVGRDKVLEQMILNFSQEWKSKHKNIRLKFSVGNLNFNCEDNRRFFIIFDAFDLPQAIITCLPYNRGKAYYVDVMQHHQKAPLGTMEKLIYDSFNMLKYEGVEEISLGLAPLAQSVENLKNSYNTIDKAFRWIYKNGSSVYRFKNLYQFKKKFNPCWEKRYLVYYPNKISLVFLYALIRLKIDEKISLFILKLIKTKVIQIIEKRVRLKNTAVEQSFHFEAND